MEKILLMIAMFCFAGIFAQNCTSEYSVQCNTNGYLCDNGTGYVCSCFDQVQDIIIDNSSCAIHSLLVENYIFHRPDRIVKSKLTCFDGDSNFSVNDHVISFDAASWKSYCWINGNYELKCSNNEYNDLGTTPFYQISMHLDGPGNGNGNGSGNNKGNACVVHGESRKAACSDQTINDLLERYKDIVKVITTPEYTCVLYNQSNMVCATQDGILNLDAEATNYNNVTFSSDAISDIQSVDGHLFALDKNLNVFHWNTQHPGFPNKVVQFFASSYAHRIGVLGLFTNGTEMVDVNVTDPSVPDDKGNNGNGNNGNNGNGNNGNGNNGNGNNGNGNGNAVDYALPIYKAYTMSFACTLFDNATGICNNEESTILMTDTFGIFPFGSTLDTEFVCFTSKIPPTLCDVEEELNNALSNASTPLLDITSQADNVLSRLASETGACGGNVWAARLVIKESLLQFASNVVEQSKGDCSITDTISDVLKLGTEKIPRDHPISRLHFDITQEILAFILECSPVAELGGSSDQDMGDVLSNLLSGQNGDCDTYEQVLNFIELLLEYQAKANAVGDEPDQIETEVLLLFSQRVSTASEQLGSYQGLNVSFPVEALQQAYNNTSFVDVAISTFDLKSVKHCRNATKGEIISDIHNINLVDANGTVLSIKHLDDPIVFTIPLTDTALSLESETCQGDGKQIQQAACSYWSETNLDWEMDGCTSKPISDGTHMECSCSHLTEFAILLRKIECPTALTNAETNGYVVLISLYSLTSVLIMYRIYQIKKYFTDGMKGVGTLLWQHIFLLVITVARVVVLGLYLANENSQVALAVVILPYILTIPTFLLVVANWVAVIKFALKTHNPFKKVLPYFLGVSVFSCLAVAITIILAFIYPSNTMKNMASVTVAVISTSISLAFVIYGKMLGKSLLSSATCNSGLTNLVPRIYKVAVLCALFFIFTSILLVITFAAPQFYKNNFETMDFLYHASNLANLWVLIYFFALSIQNGKKAYQRKTTLKTNTTNTTNTANSSQVTVDVI